MKPIHLILVILPLIISSCGSSQKETDIPVNDSTQTDDDAISETDSTLTSILQKFNTVNELPLTIDSVFMTKINKADSLENFEVRVLANSWLKHAMSEEHSYDIEQFYHIDSLKQENKYMDYVKGLDIGMIKYSNVYAISQIKINDSTSILLWALEYGSYEACPYSSGTTVYFTVLVNKDFKQCFVLGEDMVAGDPPISMERKITGKIGKDGKINLEMWEKNEDGNEEVTTEINTAQYSIEIINGEIKVTSEKKDKPKVTVKKAE